jgi:hypothetical protein
MLPYRMGNRDRDSDAFLAAEVLRLIKRLSKSLVPDNAHRRGINASIDRIRVVYNWTK